ncbi:hypothetical protein [Metabacillus indicus]|uniref:hypothetical protein n=1 Tax=Metabacillus indicus TaxID=246786 RepID=UPI003CF8550B
MFIKIKINNQFLIKQGLKIALEIARYELTSEQIDRINNLINQLDNSQNKLELTTSQFIIFDIKDCIRIFKRSESIQWIRTDFIREILALETSF